MIDFDVIVIGGGAAGIMAAATAGGKVCLLEKNDSLGKKLAITGGGRCNVTNATDVEGILEKTVNNPHFLYSALYSLTPDGMIDFLNKIGVATKIEAAGRVFPISDSSLDVIKAFEQYLYKKGVDVRLNSDVTGISASEDFFTIHVNQKNLTARKVIIATGGMSFPTTGSTGDGYQFAKVFGHKIIPPSPALVPLVCDQAWMADVMGLSLQNVRLAAKVKGRKLFDGIGEMIFTHFGISGPLVLSASAHMAGQNAANISVDLLPSVDVATLDKQLLDSFAKNPNRNLSNALDQFLPKKLIPIIINLSRIPLDKKINALTKEERAGLIAQIKGISLTVTGTRGFKEAMISAGGIKTTEIDPSTMESKIIPRLFFAGEVIDVHALTGGYNLQIAFSTGYLAALSCS